jgi:predicted nucleotidyltransferase
METETLSEKLDELVRRIVDAVHPLKIVLFGSAARGEVGPESDVDVMVVMPDGTHRRHTAQFLHTRMMGIGLPVDILVATAKDLEMYGDSIGLVCRRVLREGRDLYAA